MWATGVKDRPGISCRREVHVAGLWIEVIPSPRGGVNDDWDQAAEHVQYDPTRTHGIVDLTGSLTKAILSKDDRVLFLVGQLHDYRSLTDARPIHKDVSPR